MRRRIFLAATAATLGLWQPLRAKTGRRKVALLVGIDQYPEKTWQLAGALADLELQQAALTHRLGFESITTLKNAQATRAGIETAFREQLIEATTADDWVLFHFSGLGRQVKTLNGINPALVTASSTAGACDDLAIETLYQLVQALPTRNVVVVLDCGFQATQAGYYVSRSPKGEPPILGTAALDAAKDISQAYRLPKVSGLSSLTGMPKGLLLAASATQAVEGYWPDVQAGLWTYALSRSLWSGGANWLDGAIQEAVRLGHQEPLIIGSLPEVAPEVIPASGWVSGVENGNVTVWLGGLRTTVGSTLQAETTTGETVELLVRSRQGASLRAEAITTEPSVGLLVRETARQLVPGRLWVGLAPELERIERVDITSALAQLRVGDDWNLIEPEADSERAVDCILGKTEGGYGLYWPNQEPVARSFGSTGEAAKTAVQRLHGQMKHLLAAKRLEVLLNPASTKLDMTIAIASPSHYSQSQPSRHAAKLAKLTYTPHLQLTAAETLNLSLTNYGPEPLTVCLLSQDRAGMITVYSELIALERSQNLSLTATPPTGLTTLFAIATPKPLPAIREQLQQLAQRTGVSGTCLALPNPLDFVQTLWQDLASRPGSESHSWLVDRWLAVALPYDVTASA